MKYALLILLFTSQAMASSLDVSIDVSISGKVSATPGCSEKVMVYLSLDKENYKDRLLLMHTEVPKNGTFKFFARPGDYQIRAGDKAGCEFFQKVSAKEGDIEIVVKLVKK
jgi:hypothetical protein